MRWLGMITLAALGLAVACGGASGQTVRTTPSAPREGSTAPAGQSSPVAARTPPPGRTAGPGGGPPPVSQLPTVTANGLQIIDIEVGSGPVADTGNTVTIDYNSWLPNGDGFDSSYARGEPYSFVLGSGPAIKGWQEGIPGMRVGGKRRLIIPAALAYGPAGRGPVPPDATLVFDIQLLDVR